MGLIRGSGNFSRYFVSGELPENYREAFVDKITRSSFRNLDEHSDEERATGWVTIMDMFNSDFAGKEFFIYPYIALSWRVDIRKVPANALKQHYREAENRIKESENLEYLPKERRRELTGVIRYQLLKRAIPRSNTYDMIWNLDTSQVIFGSTSAKICDEFVESFSRTFDMTVSPVFPYSLAHKLLENEGIEPGLVDAVHDSNFAGGDE